MEDIYFGTLEDEDCIDSTIFENDIDDINEDYEDYEDSDESEENKFKYGY